MVFEKKGATTILCVVFHPTHTPRMKESGDTYLDNVCQKHASFPFKHGLRFLLPLALVSSLARWHCLSSFHVRSATCHVHFLLAVKL